MQPDSSHYAVEDRGYTSPCWIWRRWKYPTGYGKSRFDGQIKMAHRAYYEAYIGPIPPGMEVDHLCFQRDCVNPEHLEAVTPTENRRRSRQAKLTPVLAGLIRFMAQREKLTAPEIARRLGLSANTVRRVVKNESWHG